MLDEIKKLYFSVYEDNLYNNRQFNLLLEVIQKEKDLRPKNLKEQDYAGNSWYLSNNVVGMMLYVDRFSINLSEFKKRIPYLKEMGITLVHLMPLLKSRSGNNDGGYAVSDYLNVDSKFGSKKDLLEVIDLLKKEGIHTCIDFVLNHTAKEHVWAKKARLLEKKYQDMYYMYSDKDIVKKYEESFSEIFPSVAPGNFTYYQDINKYVMTRFYEFQWDLNYKNSFVLVKIVETLLKLANMGIDVLRLDAVPYMWKIIGESSINRVEAHNIIKLLNLVVKYATPSVMLLGEAIVEPNEIIKYFGDDNNTECEVLYNASMMVLYWNSLAMRDTRIMTKTLQKKYSIPRSSTWINYARCHDDIGWGLENDIVESFGFNSFSHKQFLIDFYLGRHPSSFSIGELYEFNPKTLDARNCGTMASLCGLEKAIKHNNSYEIKLSIARILLLNSILISFSGIPMLYSGDEIGMLNDWSYKENINFKNDSRWLHRGRFDWEVLNKLKDETSIEANINYPIKKMIKIRKKHQIFSSNIESKVLDFNNQKVFSFEKNDKLFVIANFTEEEVFLERNHYEYKLYKSKYKNLLNDQIVYVNERITLKAYETLWLYDEN